MGILRKLRSHTRQSMTQFVFFTSCERDLPGTASAILAVGGPEFLEKGRGSNRGSYAASVSLSIQKSGMKCCVRI